jgi:hypothetical protein
MLLLLMIIRGKFNTKYKSFNWNSVGLSLARA